MPAVSVVMPVFNGSQFLKDSMESILSQSFADFEFLIFNDGSIDSSADIVRSFQDDRIRFFDFRRNRGYVPLLNLGIRHARGKYMARMDADDISMPDRLQKQFDFMEANPDYVVCGSFIRHLGTLAVARLPVDDCSIKLKLLAITPFSHPATFIRMAPIRERRIFYSEAHMPAEDLHMWTVLADVGKFVNLPEVLLEYRIHDNNISLKPRTEEQVARLKESRKMYIAWFFSEMLINEKQLDILYRLFVEQGPEAIEQLREMAALVKLMTEKIRSSAVPLSLVNAYLVERFLYKCTISTAWGLGVFLIANLHFHKHIPVYFNLKLFIKSIIRYTLKQ